MASSGQVMQRSEVMAYRDVPDVAQRALQGPQRVRVPWGREETDDSLAPGQQGQGTAGPQEPLPGGGSRRDGVCHNFPRDRKGGRMFMFVNYLGVCSVSIYVFGCVCAFVCVHVCVH